jgi:hypothetical protein
VSATVFRQVTTTLELKCRAPGGKKICDAIAEAHTNLASLAESSLSLIEDGIARMHEIAGVGDLPVTDAGLAEMHDIADRLMGYCLTVDRPCLAESLHTLCELTDAVRRSPLWLAGTFAPMLTITTLAARGSLSRSDCDTLLAGVRRCIDRYIEALESP